MSLCCLVGLVNLQIPALPVTEGSSVNLSCIFRNITETLESSHCSTAGFYKNGSLIRNETNGEITITTVSRSDVGPWKCSCENIGESPESRMTVISSTPSISTSTTSSPSPSSNPSPTTTIPDVSMSLSRLLCSVLVVSPYLVVSTVLVVKCSINRA
ncbi:hypothetical protein DPEC_G00106620 [Dallia pectoralis]|uniref:Uncharacterized protein n=1 Tax=Dallia pectoralis TaxID=75939 RepID=A0ACC2GYY0_DALPE|nr:hypothetical protein DPEC_G00106620 [Dallia pectoralis]